MWALLASSNLFFFQSYSSLLKLGTLRPFSLSLWLSDALHSNTEQVWNHRKISLILLSKLMHELQVFIVFMSNGKSLLQLITSRSIKTMPYTYSLDTYDGFLLQWFCDFYPLPSYCLIINKLIVLRLKQQTESHKGSTVWLSAIFMCHEFSSDIGTYIAGLN